MAQDSWIGDPISVSFFCFPFCSTSPVSTSVARGGVRGFILCASIPFLFFALLPCLSFVSFSLALMRADSAVVVIGCLSNNKKKNSFYSNST